MSGSKGAPKKRISQKEKEFAELMVRDGIGSIEAARRVFGWKCEPNSSEAERAKSIARSVRVKKYRSELETQVEREITATKLMTDVAAVRWDTLRANAFQHLLKIRDNEHLGTNVRYNAVKALEKLADPSTDVNLIYMWLDIIWRGTQTHCPCCHKTYPTFKIKNEKLDSWRANYGAEPTKETFDIYERRLEVIKRAELRQRPHESQAIALKAPERHVVGLGPARAGKSFLLATMALLTFLIPGSETWILARIYANAKSEVGFLRQFLNTLFFPYYKSIVKEHYDAKTEELTLTSKWGSILKVMSSKAKGSITGRELDMALVAEPAWVTDDIFEELRARMSSRLGRIIMLGTPKGYGGLLGRMVNLIGRDPKTKKIIRIPPEKRTIASGCPWNISLLKYQMKPDDNPAYVKSERDAARMELMDDEYASEFEGLMTTAEGAKFPQIKHVHLSNIPRSIYEDCYWVLGIDQGPKNFAACLIGTNGQKIVVSREYFEQDVRTMKAHLEDLRRGVRVWIRQVGGNPDNWKLTITDADPPLVNELAEFEEEGSPWPTDVISRPKNKSGQFSQENWRKETYEFINVEASKNNLRFDLNNCDLLHDQLMRVLDKPEDRSRDNTTTSKKGWIINDPYRGDHVVDAFVLAMYTILSGLFVVPNTANPEIGDPWEEAKNAFAYNMAVDEARQLRGYAGGRPVTPEDIFEQTFGRRRRTSQFLGGMPGYYRDES